MSNRFFLPLEGGFSKGDAHTSMVQGFPEFYEIQVACEQTSGSPLFEFTHQTTCGPISDRS